MGVLSGTVGGGAMKINVTTIQYSYSTLISCYDEKHTRAIRRHSQSRSGMLLFDSRLT